MNKLVVKVEKEVVICSYCNNEVVNYYLSEFEYGKLLVKYKEDSYAYIDLIEDEEYKPFCDAFEEELKFRGIKMSPIDTGALVQKSFLDVCDKIDNISMSIGQKRKCPTCNQKEISGSVARPIEIVDLECDVITHNEWSALSNADKIAKIRTYIPDITPSPIKADTMDGFYFLFDKEHQDLIVGKQGRRCFEYIYGLEDWIPFRMLEYYVEEDPKYDCYQDIEDFKAISIIENQRKLLESIYEKLQDLTDNVYKADDNLEKAVVGTYIINGKDFYRKNKKILDGFFRVANAIEAYHDFINPQNENDLFYLRRWRNISEFALAHFEREYKSGNLDAIKYKILMDYMTYEKKTLSDYDRSVLFVYNGNNCDKKKSFFKKLFSH